MEDHDQSDEHATEQDQRGNGTTEASTSDDNPEPIHDDPDGRLGDLDDALESHRFPATRSELIEAYGQYEIETRDGRESLDEVLSGIDDQTYDSADDARSRILGLIRR